MALANPVLPERYVPWPSLNRALLGRGGASEVWRVRDQDLGVLVALKVLRREGARFQARLEREAALSARILHPKVVGVHDIGRTPQGHSYIAFALASDGSMLDLGSRPLPWPDLKEMLVDLLEALAACHARGILHLDVKLSNLLLHRPPPTGKRVLWLADLGVARARFDDEDQSVIGTVSYMPPERLTGQHHLWQPSSDVFSVGAVLYRILVGKLPFPANDPAEGLAQRQQPPKRLKIRAGYVVPPGLDELVLASLQPDPRSRFDLAADLLRALNSLPSVDQPVPPPVNPAGRPLRSAPGVPVWYRPAPLAVPLPPPTPTVHRRVPQAPALLVHREIPLVGRDRELAALWGAADRVRMARRVHVVHLTGPRGSGRTRLVEEFTRAAEEAGVGEGFLVQYAVADGPNFGLRGAWRRIAPPPVSDRERDHRKYPQQLATTLARDRRTRIDNALPDAKILARWIHPHGAEPPSDRSYARSGLIEMLEHRSWRGLSWLWFDDLHLADVNDDAWVILEQLMGLEAPVLVIAGTSTEALSPSLLELEARHPERFQTLELEALVRSDADQLARTYLPLHSELVADLVTTTAGSPQYMKALLLHWTRADLLQQVRDEDHTEPVWTRAPNAPPLPVDRAAFARRLVEFTAGTARELLEPLLVVALAGRGTPEAVLSEVIGPELDALIVSGLVALEGGAPVLVPPELEAELPRFTKDAALIQELHGRLARAWARQGEDDPLVQVRIGQHRAAAGDLANAVEPLDQALASLEHTLPVPELAKLGALMRRATAGTGRKTSEAWARATRVLSRAYGRAGHLDRALVLDAELEAATLRPGERMLSACLHAEHLAEQTGPAQALSRLASVQDEVPDLRPHLRSHFHTTRALCLAAALHTADAHADIQAALSQQPPPEVETRARLLRAELLQWADPSVAWHEALRTIEVARDHGLLREEIAAWGIAGAKMAQLGQAEAAVARMDAGVARLRAHGDRSAAARALLQKGDVLRAAGLLHGARSAWTQGIAEAGGHAASVRTQGHLRLAALAVSEGDTDSVRHELEALHQDESPRAQAACALLKPWLALHEDTAADPPLAATVAQVAQLGLDGMVLAHGLIDALTTARRPREADRVRQVLILSSRVLGIPADLGQQAS